MAHDAGDPAADPRADYDYRGGPETAPALAATLRDRVAGDVRFDAYTRRQYATDASLYEVEPVGVVLPRSTADVAATVETCAEHGTAVLPRGGGTSLAGQAVNEAVVLDLSRHMDTVREVDPEAGTAIADPGVTLARLNQAAADHGLTFGPDPAWGDKSVLGGAVGNNSTGAHSLVYEKTDGYVESAEVVLADGTVARLGEVALPELRAGADPEGSLLERVRACVARIVDEEAEAVREAFPELKRNVSGYGLDRLVADAESGSVNLARLLCGSEGTLAVVTEVTVALEPAPAATSAALLCYPTLEDALTDVDAVLGHDPAAVEVLDDVLLELARERPEFADVVDLLPPDAGAVLLVEFYAATDRAAGGAVAGLLADRGPADATAGVQVDLPGPAAAPGGQVRTDDPARATGALAARDEARRARFWALRKSGLPILLSRTSDAKHVSFIEDTAVPPARLPEFVAGFREILADHDTFASYYAHAGPGVLHVRPLVDVSTVAGREAMLDIADRVTDLVVELGGSVSGEHGDGRARTRWNRKLYGEHVLDLFRQLKAAFDPQGLLNPGQVCGDVQPDEHLRAGPDRTVDPGFEPTLEWDVENGIRGMVELCHGCGGCRGHQETTGGQMCPTYRAHEEESLSTRGRANMLREAMEGELGEDALLDPEFGTEVLDLCVGCKGCARDCPSGVDLAKLKVEVEHARHEAEGIPFRDRLFGRIHELARVGSATAPLSNLLARLPGADALGERLLGVARERDLPTFRRDDLRSWLAAREPAVPAADARARVLLFPDTFTTYVHPDVGRAAVRVLEAAGVHVRLATGVTGSGRPPHSLGRLELARRRARRNVAALAPAVADGWDVVVVEPSDAVMLGSDYRDLLDGPEVDRVADAVFGVCEYLDRRGLSVPTEGAAARQLTYHGHCHQTAVGAHAHAPALLRAAGHEVTALDSTCCGMAGTFGYEAEHHSMSVAIRGLLEEQLAGEPGRLVTAGTSCRTQLADAGYDPLHPVEVLAASIER